MKFPREHTLKEIAGLLDVEFVGPESFPVLGLNEIHVVEPGDIVFVDHPKYYDKALESKATVVLINKSVDCPEGKALLISDDPFRDFNKLINYFGPPEIPKQAIHPTATISPDAIIGANVVIGAYVTIGAGCIIHPNVSIGDYCILGEDVVIQSGSVIGSNAFYYKKRPEGYDRLISGGRVILEDRVELGALCTIDRGVTGDTRIGTGSKLDNQVHVGHDTVIGAGCLIASQAGIAGCVIIEDGVTLWGQVGVTSAITVGKGAVVLAQSGIAKSLEGGKTYFGSPAEEARDRLKQLAGVRQIPAILETLKKQGKA